MKFKKLFYAFCMVTTLLLSGICTLSLNSTTVSDADSIMPLVKNELLEDFIEE